MDPLPGEGESSVERVDTMSLPVYPEEDGEVRQPEDIVEQVLQQLTLRQKIGQRFISGFQGRKMSKEAKKLIEQGYLGAHLIDRDYHAWFHWPAYHPSPQQAEAACDCNR